MHGTVRAETRERNTRESRKRKKEERTEHTRVPREPTHTHTRHAEPRIRDRNGEIIAARTLPIAYMYIRFYG